MSIFDWFKRLVGTEPSRDTGADESREYWNSTTPTKNRRRLSPDERFQSRERNWWGFLTKSRRMNSKDAMRHFSASLATGDPALRRAGTDLEQLERYGLPKWESEGVLAEFLALTKGRLAYFACHRRDDSIDHYVSFRVPKKTGGSRVIMAPKRELRQIQRKLLRELVNRFPVSDYAHGFRRGRSIRTNAEPHCGKKLVL